MSESSLFLRLMEKYKSGELQPDNLRLKALVTPPQPGDILDPNQLSHSQRRELITWGEQALQQGQVAALVLAGGMATRFAYELPKALFPILEHRSFLELKILTLKQYQIPLCLMTSFHTHAQIVAFLEKHHWFDYRERIFLFQQSRLPRIYRDGSIRYVNDQVDYATSGHGDFVSALVDSGLLYQLKAQGIRYLLFSNIDNLGATPDALLLGLHINQEVEMTIEVAAKAPGDKGGAPARVNQRLQLVEEFLFPGNFDQDQIQVFNTASYIFSLGVLERSFQLPWYAVEKIVAGQHVIQFERLAGDLSRELNILCILVDRKERFLPVKQQADVDIVRPLLEHRFANLL